MELSNSSSSLNPCSKMLRRHRPEQDPRQMPRLLGLMHRLDEELQHPLLLPPCVIGECSIPAQHRPLYPMDHLSLGLRQLVLQIWKMQTAN